MTKMDEYHAGIMQAKQMVNTAQGAGRANVWGKGLFLVLVIGTVVSMFFIETETRGQLAVLGLAVLAWGLGKTKSAVDLFRAFVPGRPEGWTADFIQGARSWARIELLLGLAMLLVSVVFAVQLLRGAVI